MVSSQLLVLKPLRPVYPILMLFKIYSLNTLFMLESSSYMSLSRLSGRHPELKCSSCGNSESQALGPHCQIWGSLLHLPPLPPPFGCFVALQHLHRRGHRNRERKGNSNESFIAACK